MHVEPVKDYKRDHDGVRDLLGTTQFLSQASFVPTPVDTSQVTTTTSQKLTSVFEISGKNVDAHFVHF